MSYGKNSPFGLKVYGHQIGGTDDIKVNNNYTISANSELLNKGDPVMYVPQSAQYNVTAGGYQGKEAEIMLYRPVVDLTAAGNATIIQPANGGEGQPIVGVFQSCEYYEPNGTYVSREYWVPGTPTNGKPVIASIIDDPYVIFDIQLGTYLGANANFPTQFLLLPCLQIESAAAGWPLTGSAAGAEGTDNEVRAGGAADGEVRNSALIGTNLTLAVGKGPGLGEAGATDSLSSIELNGKSMKYQDNPLTGSKGRSAFYACPSIAATNAMPSVTDGPSEYSRTTANSGDLRVLGFTPDSRNVPGEFGLPGLGTPGNYFNTPFLNVLVTINKHVNKAGTIGVVIT